uniref:Uncharacterized protein n=1 Tax=Chrysotila carterae TaxID=13221 RepID=A0A7S4C0G9_CHRCT
MGLCGGGAQVADDDGGARAELEAAKKANRRIATRLMDDEFASKSKRKMLLLGAGESGKSTLFKQMQVIHGGGYTDDERMSFRWIIHRNVIDAMKILLEAAADMDLKIAEENEDRADRVEMWEAENLNEAFAADIDALWRDPAIQACFGRKNEFQLGDGAVYFLNDVFRVSEEKYVPSVDDILRSRVRTSGVVNKEFLLRGKSITLFDVGGQRSERRKWISFFDDVDAIIFVAAISEFDQVLAEDNSKNRMQESLELFEQIVNSHYFASKSLLLFLNKKDIFEEKLKKGVDPGKWFPDYRGGCDQEKAELYFRTEFEKRMRDESNEEGDEEPEDLPEEKTATRTNNALKATEASSRVLYSYATTATDTANIKVVFKIVMDVIEQKFEEERGISNL